MPRSKVTLYANKTLAVLGLHLEKDMYAMHTCVFCNEREDSEPTNVMVPFTNF